MATLPALSQSLKPLIAKANLSPGEQLAANSLTLALAQLIEANRRPGTTEEASIGWCCRQSWMRRACMGHWCHLPDLQFSSSVNQVLVAIRAVCHPAAALLKGTQSHRAPTLCRRMWRELCS